MPGIFSQATPQVAERSAPPTLWCHSCRNPSAPQSIPVNTYDGCEHPRLRPERAFAHAHQRLAAPGHAVPQSVSCALHPSRLHPEGRDGVLHDVGALAQLRLRHHQRRGEADNVLLRAATNATYRSVSTPPPRQLVQ